MFEDKDYSLMLDNDVSKYTIKVRLSDNIEKTKEGYLICDNAVFGRTGIQKYYGKEIKRANPNKHYDFKDEDIIEVHRTNEEVFSEITLDSFVSKPLTLYHPNERVTIDNFQSYSKGIIPDRPKRVDNTTVGRLIVNDKKVVKYIEKKQLRELSLGYECDVELIGDRYCQTNIMINHIALLDKGRAGIALIKDNELEKIFKEENKMEKENITINIQLGDELKKLLIDEKKVEEEKEKDDKEAKKDDKKEEKAKKKDDEEADEDDKKEEKGDKKEMTRDEALKILGITEDNVKEILDGKTKAEQDKIIKDMQTIIDERVENAFTKNKVNDKEPDIFNDNDINLGGDTEFESLLNDMFRQFQPQNLTKDCKTVEEEQRKITAMKNFDIRTLIGGTN